MSYVILQKDSVIRLVPLGPSLQYSIFNIFSLFFIHFRIEIFFLLCIQIMHTFLFFFILYANTMVLFIIFPLVLLLYLVSLISYPCYLWYIVIWLSYALIYSLLSSKMYTATEIFLLILLLFTHIAINLYCILSCNKWNCKKLLDEGYTPRENDVYSQKLLQYYMK